jgi:ornithine decarboxylase
VAVDRISFGNTIKKEKDIAWAYQQGVRLFAFDSEAELQKLARVAPGAQVFCRVLVDCGGAEWPLSKKFGCAPEMAKDLLRKAKDWGLDAYGISFHVGSQQTDLEQWDTALGQVSQMFFALAEEGVDLRMVNLGGGFPARYRAEVNGIEAYCEAVDPRAGAPLRQPHAGGDHRARPLHGGRRRRDPERGRAGLAQGGQRPQALGLPRHRQVLGPGRDHGREHQVPPAHAPRRHARRPVVLAGPTCDSADILYEKTEYKLPLSLKPGDKVEILSTGAYTTTYSSVAFNGFAPLKAICI